MDPHTIVVCHCFGFALVCFCLFRFVCICVPEASSCVYLNSLVSFRFAFAFTEFAANQIPAPPVTITNEQLQEFQNFLDVREAGLENEEVQTAIKEGLFDDALIKPHDPSSRENLTPLTVNTSIIL